MAAHKFDHPPLLAPGRHFMTLREIESLAFIDFMAKHGREEKSSSMPWKSLPRSCFA